MEEREPPVATDEFLSKELRAAFAEAAADDELWDRATREPERFVEERGVAASDRFSVAFLEATYGNDRVSYTIGGETLLEMYCPPLRMWWEQCRKLMRVCEKRTIIVDGTPRIVDVNCHIVCAEFIGQAQLTLPQRPPFPPLPLPR